MNGTSEKTNGTKPSGTWVRAIGVCLRVTGFVVWGTFAGAAFAQSAEHRVVKVYDMERAKIEDLQRWVNDGHDTWCRNAESVAAATLRGVAPEIEGEYELASADLEKEKAGKTRAVYDFHSLDGQTTYRVIVRRYAGAKAGSASKTEEIWAPERVEIVTRATRN